MKKAMDVQFNWVFVLIAGALILLFFGSIVTKQKSLSELSASQDIVLKLGKKLSVSATELGKSEEMDFEGKELRISCYELSSGKATQRLADPVFSPDYLKGAKLITLTKALYTPFRVTNLFYVTSSSVRYILVYDPASDDSESLAKIIKEDMGDKVYPELINIFDVDDIEDLGHYKTKIVFVKTNIQNPTKLKGDIKAVQILDNNMLKFFKGKDMDEEGDSVYLSRDLQRYRETILGAIFAEDKEAYECSLVKAVKKLNMMSKLYRDRTSELRSKAPSDCNDLYFPASIYIGILEQRSEEIQSEISENLNPDPNNINDLKSAANDLELQNNILIMASCPEIY